MATYVNDLRLKEIGTGESSGTWGTETNTNLELIAEAFSYGTEASFGSDADATTTIADGATDPARSLYLKVTSGASLTATRTLTIAPNTVSKVWIIENATSGSQSINISQGSGANVTIPNGDVKVVYSDGAGSGAAVVDAFTDLNTSGTLTATNLAGTLTTAAQTNITSVGTLSSLTVSGDLTVDTSTLKVDSTNNRVGIGTTSPARPLDVNGSIRVANANAVEWGGTNEAIVGDSGGALIYKVGGAEIMRNTSTGLGIGTTTADLLSIAFDGNISSDYTAFNVDIGKASGSAITNLKGINVDLASADITGGDEITNLYGAYINNSTAGGAAGVITNWWGIYVPEADPDRTDNPVSAYFGDSVGIGTNDPQAPLHARNGSSGVSSYTAGTRAIVEGTATTYLTLAAPNTSISGILFADPDDSDNGYIKYDHSASGNMDFGTAGSNRIRINDTGEVLIGTTSSVRGAEDLSIEASSDAIAVRTAGAGLIVRKSSFTNGFLCLFETDGGSAVGSITSNGSTTAYNTSSDGRLKDITGEARGLEVINKLNPVSYNWKEDGKADEGLIAQEVLDIVPNAVTQNEEDEMYQMDYSKLVVHLVKGMKEQQAIIESLTARITTLEG